MAFDIGPESGIPETAANILRLIDLLEKTPDEKYDHMTWGEEDRECGTTACAMGWAGISRQFGFLYNPKRADKWSGMDCFSWIREGKRNRYGVDPSKIAQKVFGMSYYAAEFIFGGSYNLAKMSLSPGYTRSYWMNEFEHPSEEEIQRFADFPQVITSKAQVIELLRREAKRQIAEALPQEVAAL